MLISYNGLVDLVDRGAITPVKEESINATSIDLHLGVDVLIERHTKGPFPVIDLKERETINWDRLDLSKHDNKIIMYPGRFILAHTVEQFNLPDDVSAEFSLKSSLARNGLEHLLAGWIDPGFNNSVLTLELKNSTQVHSLLLTVGMPIGQVKFFKHDRVPPEKSYRTRGRYNGDASVSNIKP